MLIKIILRKSIQHMSGILTFLSAWRPVFHNDLSSSLTLWDLGIMRTILMRQRAVVIELEEEVIDIESSMRDTINTLNSMQKNQHHRSEFEYIPHYENKH